MGGLGLGLRLSQDRGRNWFRVGVRVALVVGRQMLGRDYGRVRIE